jgi:uncharacterized protein YpuA (DUF1002 family)
MSNTVIVPGPAGTQPTIVTEDRDDGRRHNHDCREHFSQQVAASETRRLIEDATESVRSADRRVERQASEVEARSTVEAAKNAAAGILEAAKNAAATQIAQAKDAAATQVLLQTKSDAQTLFLAQNFATSNALVNERFKDTDARLAECCCELKSLIKDDGEKTRDLVNSIQASNLALSLADAKAEIIVLKNKVPSGTVV